MWCHVTVIILSRNPLFPNSYKHVQSCVPHAVSTVLRAARSKCYPGRDLWSWVVQQSDQQMMETMDRTVILTQTVKGSKRECINKLALVALFRLPASKAGWEDAKSSRQRAPRRQGLPTHTMAANSSRCVLSKTRDQTSTEHLNDPDGL